MIVNVIVTQHLRKDHTNRSHQGTLWMVLLVVVGGFGWFHVLVTTTLQGGYAVRKFVGEFVYHLTVHTGKTVAMLIFQPCFCWSIETSDDRKFLHSLLY